MLILPVSHDALRARRWPVATFAIVGASILMLKGKNSREVVAALGESGCDEFVFVPTTDDPRELDRLDAALG